jgi:hypothetical protein
MTTLITPTIPKLAFPDKLKEAAESYVESERERWEETKELGPIGTFKRGLRQGVTGPAPTLDPDGSVNYGPGPIGNVNELASEAFGVDPDEASERDLPLTAIAGVVMLLGLLYLLRPFLTVAAEAAVEDDGGA